MFLRWFKNVEDCASPLVYAKVGYCGALALAGSGMLPRKANVKIMHEFAVL